MHLLALLSLEKFLPDSCPYVTTLKLVNESPSPMTQLFFKLLPLFWDLVQVSLFEIGRASCRERV